MSGIDAILDRVVAATRIRLEKRRATRSLEDLTRRIEALPTTKEPRFSSTGALDVWAEIKPASPVKGILKDPLDVTAQAAAYHKGGATVLSILTEQDFFQGSLANLESARRGALDLPLLRKDFLLEPEEIFEARAAGADGVLLIVRLLDDQGLRVLLETCAKLGMFALTEAYTEKEVDRAVGAGAQIVGVNARDLATFEVDPAKLEACRRRIPPDRFAVAESGVRSGEQLTRLRAIGYHAVLVGETLMRAEDPAGLLDSWRRACGAE